ncbi:transglutaminase-like cysteine peptidase [Vibrio coralliilyticus]|jgi:predicted transglutaminase-like cysteine proteinase|uniref:Sulfate adenylyltransferase n=1 Tax=Vibrio coralliilyticus TaxID=190893 RepID=A0AAP6ZJP6_9VIBR|nr:MULTISPECIES: transglutaminase-like cysteine peptidase [Vibrio]ERB62904.1 sulfate adenylyltransferase [Vibrio coralliilyticus OCN008]NOI74078.1 sulfate adenylyltransferase [Vibrio coralliilyticus]NOJ21636.1 sulfate adenylyltransferase [Vibrio coralliilyticus]NRF27248.1 transglutaminase-like cysteine peptidase [Vibrio coralliilyticus]NRF81500.1 transglutaminase-like cysteine peptidase [Vibrio coralliilyticus]
MKYWLAALFIILASTASQALNTQEQRWVEAVRNTYGDRAGKRVETWRREMEQFKGLSERQKLTEVNSFFNQLNFVNDDRLWGKKDYWATPLEFLGSNAGDCEDFTIAKYFSLLELGVSDKKLRLVYVKAITLNQFHMVLAYYSKPSAEPILLDNIDPQIKKASKRRDLLPIYSFNGKNLWLMKSKQGQLAGKSSRLSLWNDLRAREKSLKLNKPIVNYDE